MDELRVDIWSDIACPWCYVGKRRFEAALEQFEHGHAVKVVWRAFELDPSAPAMLASEPSYAERLARKYRVSLSEAQMMIASMTEVAAKDGLAFRFDRIRPGNTFDAHRLLHFAHKQGKQDALKERLLAAYLCEGEAIGDKPTLARLAPEAGLDAAEVTRVLDGDEHAEAVRADEEEASTMRVSGVPFFMLAGLLGVSGAQETDTLALVLQQAWDHVASGGEVTARAASCSIHGCE